MVRVAVVGSLIEGNNGGEHNGHYDDEGKPIHSVSALTGKILSGCGFAFIKGKEVATVGSATEEICECCGGTIIGAISDVPNFVYANGKAVVLIDQSFTPHNGQVKVASGVEL